MPQEKSKILYIDVTQSFAWEGEAMGIIRVMDEISRRFIDDPIFETVFIIWDETARQFYKVDYAQALDKRSKSEISYLPKARHAPPYKSLIRRALVKIPGTKTVYKTMILKNNQLTNALDHKKTVRFSEDAILFMPHGGVWESRSYSQKLTKLKAERNIQLVPILYDLCPVLTPQFSSEGIRKVFDRHMRQMLPAASLVLAISENTKRDCFAWLGAISKTKEPVVEVIRLGDEICTDVSIKPKGLKTGDYILCVGTIEARKNHASLYYAYKLAQERGIDLPPIVIVGRKGWMADDSYEIMTTDPAVNNSFIFLHNANDNELTWLYENALFSVYPTFYEGWGLPVAESLLRGLPCLASASSSIPEIAGPLVEYFSPYSPDEILQKIQLFSTNKTLLKKRAAQIKSNYVATTWDSTVNQVKEQLKSI